MPLYEYQCQQCGHRFEKIQSFSAPDEKECPKCAGALERLISAPAIQFKGAGWYVNDYSGRNKAPASGSSDGGSKDTGGKDASSGSSDKSSKSDGGSKNDGGNKKSDSGTSSTPASESSNAKPTTPAANNKSSN